MMQTCNDCHEEFESWVELAQHLVSQRKTHKRESVVWALAFLAKKDNIKEFKPRIAISEETRQILKECVRELSGNLQEVRIVCPDCKKVDSLKLPVEYIQDGEAWRNSHGTLIVNCLSCKRER